MGFCGAEHPAPNFFEKLPLPFSSNIVFTGERSLKAHE
jgi:hypothetical protein